MKIRISVIIRANKTIKDGEEGEKLFEIPAYGFTKEIPAKLLNGYISKIKSALGKAAFFAETFSKLGD